MTQHKFTEELNSGTAKVTTVYSCWMFVILEIIILIMTPDVLITLYHISTLSSNAF